MTRTELIKLLTLISNSYPKQFEFPRKTEESSEMLIKTWTEFLIDYDYKHAKVAVKKFAVNNPKWPPSVGQVVQEVEKIKLSEADKLTAAEAWGEVERAIRFHGKYSSKEALESMSPLTAKVVKSMGWRDICNGIKLSVTRGQFLKMYKQMYRRRQHDEMLPAGLKQDIDKIAASEAQDRLESSSQSKKVVELMSDVASEM